MQKKEPQISGGGSARGSLGLTSRKSRIGSLARKSANIPKKELANLTLPTKKERTKPKNIPISNRRRMSNTCRVCHFGSNKLRQKSFADLPSLK